MHLTSRQCGFWISLGVHAVLFIGLGIAEIGQHSDALPKGERERATTLTLLVTPDEPPVIRPEAAPPPIPVPQQRVKRPQAIMENPRPAPVVPPAQTLLPEQQAVFSVDPSPIPVPRETPNPSIEPPPTTAPAKETQQPLEVPLFSNSDPRPLDEGASKPKPAVGFRAEPSYQKNPPPPYPLTARRRKQEGLVLLQVKISPEGRATRVQVKKSSGFPLLDDAALDTVKTWVFFPAREASVPVESEIEVPVRFKLQP